MNCGKTQEESKFLSSCVSAWSPVHWHSLLHSPLCCRHLVCRSPWQWVSVPPFFHLSASHDFSLSAALLVLKPVLIYESSRITWARLKAGDIAQDLTQQLDDLSCQQKKKTGFEHANLQGGRWFSFQQKTCLKLHWIHYPPQTSPEIRFYQS